MNYDNQFFLASDHTELFWRTWVPQGEIKALIIIIHGLGEHSARYHDWATRLAYEGYYVASFDQRGHGLTQGKRGFAPSYAHLLEDIHTFIALQKMHMPDVKIILYGHSMGGNLMLNYLLKYAHDIHAAVASSPALVPAFRLPLWKRTLGVALRPIWPGLTLSSGISTKALSRDAQSMQHIYTDTLLHKKTTLDIGLSIIEHGNWAVEQAHTLTIPLYLQHGLADRLTCPKATQSFANNAPSHLVTLQLYDNLYHELHHEPEAELVLLNLLAWLHEVTY